MSEQKFFVQYPNKALLEKEWDMFVWESEPNSIAAVAHIHDQIELLYVDAEYQGRGIGTSLLKKAALDIKELDGLADTLRVLAPESAVGFFEKLGFAPRGEAFEQGSLKMLPMGLKGERV